MKGWTSSDGESEINGIIDAYQTIAADSKTYANDPIPSNASQLQSDCQDLADNATHDQSEAPIPNTVYQENWAGVLSAASQAGQDCVASAEGTSPPSDYSAELALLNKYLVSLLSDLNLSYLYAGN